MNLQLTIGIIPCGRLHKVTKCLASIQKNVHLDYQIIVVDSMIAKDNLSLYESYHNTRCIAFESPISPSAARKIVAENADTPYIMFLDDDIEVRPESIDTMLTYLQTHSDVDIVGGAWFENGKFRELGQHFNFGTLRDKKVIYKSFVTLNEAVQLELTSVQVDCVQATMLVKKEIFEKVQFDPQYDFFFEWFDFFLQCYQHKLHIDALPNVIFEHYPGQYTNSTLRQNSDQENDQRKFHEKWGMHPIGSLGGVLSFKDSEINKPRLVSFITRVISSNLAR